MLCLLLSIASSRKELEVCSYLRGRLFFNNRLFDCLMFFSGLLGVRDYLVSEMLIINMQWIYPYLLGMWNKGVLDDQCNRRNGRTSRLPNIVFLQYMHKLKGHIVLIINQRLTDYLPAVHEWRHFNARDFISLFGALGSWFCCASIKGRTWSRQAIAFVLY